MKIPKIKQLELDVPKDNNFRIEEGKYRAKIIKVRRTDRQNAEGSVQGARILFEVNVPGSNNVLNLAKADFKLDLEHGSELRNVLTRLLGKEAFLALSGKKLDLEQFVGMDVEIEIEHVFTNSSENYTYPLVVVRDIQKSGTLALTEYREANQ